MANKHTSLCVYTITQAQKETLETSLLVAMQHYRASAEAASMRGNLKACEAITKHVADCCNLLDILNDVSEF